MTETEAKTKWCPMVRYERDLVNRSDPHPQNMNCIGSACMMWREIREIQFEPDSKVLGGFCGLAGKQ